MGDREMDGGGWVLRWGGDYGKEEMRVVSVKVGVRGRERGDEGDGYIREEGVRVEGVRILELGGRGYL